MHLPKSPLAPPFAKGGMGGIKGFDTEMGRNISVDRAPRTSLHLLCCLVAHFYYYSIQDNIRSQRLWVETYIAAKGESLCLPP